MCFFTGKPHRIYTWIAIRQDATKLYFLKEKIVIKLELTVLLLLSFSTAAFSCLVATQERIIPLGTSGDCLVGIEIISRRYGEGEYGEKEVWDYEFTLKRFDGNYSEVVISEFKSEKGLETPEGETVFKDRLRQALQVCEELTEFELLRPKNIRFCDFQQSCSSVSLVDSGEHMEIQVTGENKRFSIRCLDSDYEGEIGKLYRDYFDYYHGDSDRLLGFDLKISSIRRYQNSSHMLLIFHLGTGQEFTGPGFEEFAKKKETEFDKELDTLEDATFMEPILHHGKGFDFFKLDER